MIETAEFDPFRGDGEAYARALADGGAAAQLRVHPGMIHYFYALARAIPYAREAVGAIGADIARRLSVTCVLNGGRVATPPHPLYSVALAPTVRAS